MGIQAHDGKLGDISSNGREFNCVTSRLARMHVAIRGIYAAPGGPCATS
jgi:type I restriction-modification system DNA methylase subunit